MGLPLLQVFWCVSLFAPGIRVFSFYHNEIHRMLLSFVVKKNAVHNTKGIVCLFHRSYYIILKIEFPFLGFKVAYSILIYRIALLINLKGL